MGYSVKFMKKYNKIFYQNNRRLMWAYRMKTIENNRRAADRFHNFIATKIKDNVDIFTLQECEFRLADENLDQFTKLKEFKDYTSIGRFEWIGGIISYNAPIICFNKTKFELVDIYIPNQIFYTTIGKIPKCLESN